MKRNSGVIGVEVLVGILLGSLISFLATKNHDLNKRVEKLSKEEKVIVTVSDFHRYMVTNDGVLVVNDALEDK